MIVSTIVLTPYIECEQPHSFATLPTPAPPGSRAGHGYARTLAGMSDSVGRPEPGAWLFPADAARFLGVTVRTLGRRGLPKRRLPGQLTEVWVAGANEDNVWAPSETSDGQDDAPGLGG